MTSRPADGEYAPYYSRYIVLVPESDILPALKEQVVELTRLLEGVPREQETYRYAPGKWSIREVLGHLIDGERVFGYRAFCISRAESTPLPSSMRTSMSRNQTTMTGRWLSCSRNSP